MSGVSSAIEPAAILYAALAASQAGLCVVTPRQDGSKAPEGPWKRWQSERPDEQTIRGWYGNGRTGLGFVCGRVSGNLEMLEFEDRRVFDAYRATADALGIDDPLDRVIAGYCEATPGGGIHLLYRCSEIAGNTKLACRPKRPEEKQHERDNVAVLIETRGEGGFTIVAPSHGTVHPSGRRYRLLLGGVDTIATISPDARRQLWELAQTFDELPESMPPAEARSTGERSGHLIDDFNSRTTWRELLEPDGWTLVFQRGQVAYWRRPGKDRDVSAISSYSAEDRFACYSTSTDLETGKGYSKFGYYAHRHHGGDFKAAARELGQRGYGDQPQRSRRTSSAASAEPQDDAGAAPTTAPAKKAEGQSRERKEGAVDALIRIGQAGKLFADRLGDTYAQVDVGKHRECWPLRSKGFRRWIVRAYYEESGRAPNSEAFTSALNVLEARAQFDAPAREVYVRVAPDAVGGILIDLGDRDWRAVHITPDGWSIIKESPVAFRRSPGTQPLPEPARDGSLDELRAFMNIPDDGDWTRLKAWLRTTLNPWGPFPVLAIQGEQGSAKTTGARMVRSITDPAVPELRAEPREPRDLAIAARSAWVLGYDNVSSIPGWMSDGICRFSTGGGWAIRELHTDTDEVLFDARRPVLFTGITGYISRGDLLERSVRVTLAPISDRERRPEADVWSAFEAARPTLFGALLDDLVGALRSLPTVKLDSLPRMADFARWAVAAELGRGERPHFIQAYAESRASSHVEAIESNAIGPALRDWLGNLPEDGWQGTASDLLAQLNDATREQAGRARDWPRSARAISAELRRLAPALRATGHEVSFNDREAHTGRRLVSIIAATHFSTSFKEVPSPSSPSSPGGSDQIENPVTVSDLRVSPSSPDRGVGDDGDDGDGDFGPETVDEAV